MVALDVGRTLAPAGFDDVGVKRALHQELNLATGSSNLLNDAALSRLEGANEFAANDLTLGFRVGYPGQGGEETLGFIHGDYADTHALGVVVLNLFALTGTQQAVVHKDAGELVTNGLVHQRGGHGGVHATT